MTRETYRRKWLRYRGRYEKRGAALFRRALRKAARRIPFDNLDDYHYKISIEFNITEQSIRDAYQEFYYYIGLVHGKRVGRDINKELKKFEPEPFEEQYANFVREWLLQNGGARITSVRQELVDYLIKFVVKASEEGKTIKEISAMLESHIGSRGFYRWQIERIVRTETTAAANFGAIKAGDTSGVLLNKVWISSHDGRTRRIGKGDTFDHWEMDGIKAERNEPFIVHGIHGNALLDYPGDPTGPPGAVINCRCTTALVPKRDANGRLVFI